MVTSYGVVGMRGISSVSGPLAHRKTASNEIVNMMLHRQLSAGALPL
jgi:hypothetical protein